MFSFFADMTTPKPLSTNTSPMSMPTLVPTVPLRSFILSPLTLKTNPPTVPSPNPTWPKESTISSVLATRSTVIIRLLCKYFGLNYFIQANISSFWQNRRHWNLGRPICTYYWIQWLQRVYHQPLTDHPTRQPRRRPTRPWSYNKTRAYIHRAGARHPGKSGGEAHDKIRRHGANGEIHCRDWTGGDWSGRH